MTPLQIEILLHYYAKASDFRNGDFSAPAVRGAIDGFLDDGLLEKDDGDVLERCYKATQRTQVFVHYICKLPLPKQVWIMPEVSGQNSTG